MKGVVVYVDLENNPKETGTITKRHMGMCTIKTASKKVQISDKFILPYGCDDFISYQIDLLQQIFTFANEYKLCTEWFDSNIINKFNSRFPIETLRAVSSESDFCASFQHFLAIYRSGESIPYVLLHETSDYDEKRCMHVESSFIGLDLKLPYIRHNNRVFCNKKTYYTIDMGVMYLFLQHVMFQEAFLMNIARLQMVCDGQKRTHVYDAGTQLLHFDHAGMANRIVGFQVDLPDFFVKRKSTFTYERDIVYRMKLKELESVPAHIFVVPWHPMQFVHLQLIYALHMLEYLTVEMKVDFDKYLHWKGYKEVCGHLFVSLERADKDEMLDKNGWNPQTAIQLIAQFDPSVSYILSTSFLNEIWMCSEKQHAWLSNLQHLVQVYTNVLTQPIVTQEFLLDDCIVVINNNFLGSFHVDPLQMQASMFAEEKKRIVQFSGKCFSENAENNDAVSDSSFNGASDAASYGASDEEQGTTREELLDIDETQATDIDFLPEVDMFANLCRVSV
tara:strand:- start:7684 stop:9198 length:1515 start_codon:yes stop_codon:yes gene_type:complete